MVSRSDVENKNSMGVFQPRRMNLSFKFDRLRHLGRSKKTFVGQIVYIHLNGPFGVRVINKRAGEWKINLFEWKIDLFEWRIDAASNAHLRSFTRPTKYGWKANCGQGYIIRTSFDCQFLKHDYWNKIWT